MNARKLTEEDLELCSNLRMIGYHCKEISEMVDIGDRFLQNKLSEFKDEEYIVHVEKKDFDDNEKEQLLNYIRDDYSLYELCLMFNKDYLSIIDTYNKVLKDKYNENEFTTWTLEDDIKYILLKLQGIKNRLVGQKLGKTEKAIKSRMSFIRNRTFTPNDKREWSKDELKILKIYKEDNSKINIDDLSRVFKRTKKCINKKINEL